MDQLNNREFQGEQVTAKLTKEGVTGWDVKDEKMLTEPVIPTRPSRDRNSGRHRSVRSHRSKQTGSVGTNKTRESSNEKLSSSSWTGDKSLPPLQM